MARGGDEKERRSRFFGTAAILSSACRRRLNVDGIPPRCGGLVLPPFAAEDQAQAAQSQKGQRGRLGD